MSLQIRSAAPSWVATGTAVPGSTTRTNIKPETAIRRPENGSSPRTSPYAGDACVAFKPTPKLTPYLTRGYLASVLRITLISRVTVPLTMMIYDTILRNAPSESRCSRRTYFSKNYIFIITLRILIDGMKRTVDRSAAENIEIYRGPTDSPVVYVPTS